MLEKLFANPTVTTVFVLLATAIVAFFMDTIHASSACKARQAEKLKDFDDRVKELRETILKEEKRADHWQNIALRLMGPLEEVPNMLRRKDS